MERVHSIVKSLVEKRLQGDYAGIAALSCQDVGQRKDLIQQWPIHNLCLSTQVYYKRLDPDTLQAMLSFVTKETVTTAQRYMVVLLWEENDFKYYNTKELTTENEWQDVVRHWSTSIQAAENVFIANQTTTTCLLPEAPGDYWGDWSDNEEEQEEKEDGDDLKYTTTTSSSSSSSQEEEESNEDDDDDDDDYYDRWSKDPGTLTPEITTREEGRILLDPPKEEKEDPVTELTNMLRKSLPYPRMSMTPTTTTVIESGGSSSITSTTSTQQLTQDFRILINRAKTLGLENTEILNLIQEIII